MQTTVTAAHIIYTRTDAELVFLAGEILGTQKLNLTLEEAVSVIRSHY